MDYDQLIRNWHSKASDEDFFSKFVFEYLAFIGILKRIKFVNQNSDSGAVRELKRDENTRDTYLEKVSITPELSAAWQRIIGELDVSPLRSVDENNGQFDSIWYWKCSHQVDDPREHECAEQGKIKDLEDWENMVEFWHSIRNNLFHAAKDPNDTRDMLLIENGYKTLKPMVEILLPAQ